MESGTIIGITSGIIVVASASVVIARYFKEHSTWGRTLKYVAIEAGVLLGSIGLALLLLDMFRAVDSSHGFMAIGIPVIVGIVVFLIAVIVFFSSAVAFHRRRHK